MALNPSLQRGGREGGAVLCPLFTYDKYVYISFCMRAILIFFSGYFEAQVFFWHEAIYTDCFVRPSVPTWMSEYIHVRLRAKCCFPSDWLQSSMIVRWYE